LLSNSIVALRSCLKILLNFKNGQTTLEAEMDFAIGLKIAKAESRNSECDERRL